MKTPTTANAKFNAVYTELKNSLDIDYSDYELLEATYALVEDHKEDVKRDRAITRDYQRISELDFPFSECSSDVSFKTFEGLSVFDSNEMDGTFVPDSFIIKSISNITGGVEI